MKKISLILFLFINCTNSFSQNMFNAVSGTVSFFSHAPIEDIKAENKQAASFINSATNEIAVVIPIRNFHFAKALMEEHFNEKYMESEKFPMASFKGIIQDSITTLADGEHPVSAKGTITIHGVEKELEIKGVFKRDGNSFTIISDFKVALKDFNITIPKLLFQNIAEIIDVNVTLDYRASGKTIINK